MLNAARISCVWDIRHYYASFAERKTGYRAKSPTRRMLRRGGARYRGMTTARHSPSFTAPAEKKGWIVSKANKTGQFSIITTTPDVRTFHNYPTVYDGPPLVSLGLVALCGTPDDFALQNLLVVIKKGNIQVRPPHHASSRRFVASSRLSFFRHPGAGRDPVLRSAKLALFCFITQVDTAYQLDTALRRYDDSGARYRGMTTFGFDDARCYFNLGGTSPHCHCQLTNMRIYMVLKPRSCFGDMRSPYRLHHQI